MPPIATIALLTAALAGGIRSDWIALRWQAANGPRDVEYSNPSVKIDAGVLSVSVRRDRAVLLKQDPTIAPESNPWTTMNLQVDCARVTWRVVNSKAADSTGRIVSWHEGGPDWLAVEAGTMVAALRERLCPKA